AKAITYAGITKGLGVIPKDEPMAKASGSKLKSALGWVSKKTVWGSTGHILIADAVRAVAEKLHESPDTIQAAYWLVAQPSDPWANIKAGLKPTKTTTTKTRKLAEAAAVYPRHADGFLLTVDPQMDWGDGPIPSEEELDTITLGPGIHN